MTDSSAPPDYDWSFFYNELDDNVDHDGSQGRFVRCKEVINCPDGVDAAAELFWIEKDPYHVMLCAILQGDVAAVDDFQFSDEPAYDTIELATELERYNRGKLAKQPRQHYTVISGRNTGEGYHRTTKWVEAVDPLHAELMARERTTEFGYHFICAVVELWVPIAEDLKRYVYTTPDGKPLPPLAEEPKTRLELLKERFS